MRASSATTTGYLRNWRAFPLPCDALLQTQASSCAISQVCGHLWGVRSTIFQHFHAAHAINALSEPTFQATCTQLTRASALPIAFRVPGRAVHQRPRQLNGLNANEDSKHKLITLPRRDQAYVGCPPLPAHCASAARAHRASGPGPAQGIIWYCSGTRNRAVSAPREPWHLPMTDAEIVPDACAG